MLLNAFRGTSAAHLRRTCSSVISKSITRRAFTSSRTRLAVSKPAQAPSIKPYTAGKTCMTPVAPASPMAWTLISLVFPERLLIYNAGTIKTLIISSIKLTVFFIFAGSCLILAPAFYQDPASPAWVPVAGEFFACLSFIISSPAFSNLLRRGAYADHCICERAFRKLRLPLRPSICAQIR